jgi:hypothetical protein
VRPGNRQIKHRHPESAAVPALEPRIDVVLVQTGTGLG